MEYNNDYEKIELSLIGLRSELDIMIIELQKHKKIHEDLKIIHDRIMNSQNEPLDFKDYDEILKKGMERFRKRLILKLQNKYGKDSISGNELIYPISSLIEIIKSEEIE